jgi:hypothetical protein
VAEVLTVSIAGACGVFAIWLALRHRRAIVRGLQDRPSLLPVLVYLGVYVGALLYLSFFSRLGISDRYCYPLLGLSFVLAGLAGTLLAPRIDGSRVGRAAAVSAVLLLGCYVFMNVRDMLRPLRSASAFSSRRVAAYLAAPMASGEPLLRWIDANVPADANLFAADGQATAHVLSRKTVSLVAREYSTQSWEAPQMREMMAEFQGDFLILYSGTPSEAAPAAQAESKFLTTLMEGRQRPDWLRLAAENRYTKVFQRQEPGSHGQGRLLPQAAVEH